MKKILLIGLAVFSVACGNDDDNPGEVDCTNRLWELSKVCDPVGSTNCVYFATFGETAASAGTTQVTVNTYDYYFSRGNTNDGSLCWEGTQDD